MDTPDDAQARGSIGDTRSEISAFASAVLSVISDTPAAPQPATVRSSVVRTLVRATLREAAFSAEALLRELEDSRISADQVVDVYIPEAARELGAMWVDDSIGFARVTIASARLQGLLTLLAPPWAAEPADGDAALDVLFILQHGDTHTLGPHVATAQLRRMGASVRLLFGPDDGSLVRIVQEDPVDLILFACSRAEKLDSIAKTVKRLRTGTDLTPPIALGGLVLTLADRVKEKSGVDLVTSDVRVAVRLCDSKRHKPKLVARR